MYTTTLTCDEINRRFITNVHSENVRVGRIMPLISAPGNLAFDMWGERIGDTFATTGEALAAIVKHNEEY